MDRRLPVILVGGFLGAGKTSLLHHTVSGHQGGALVLMVEEAGPVPFDTRALGGLCGAARRSQDVVLGLPSLATSDELSAWLAARLRELAELGRFERVLIEVAGTTDPARLARCFEGDNAAAGEIARHARLQQVVVVVDALDFFREIVTPRPGSPALKIFQRAQIESATLLVLNKCDLLGEAQREACVRLLLGLNPRAFVTEAAYGEVADDVLNQSPGSRSWPVPPPGESEPLGSLVYRADRPFAPAPLWAWLAAEHPGLLRLKGIIWLATRSLLVGGLSLTRWQHGCGPAGIWWAALPREEWPTDPAARERITATWREPYGDRRQELVLLGSAAALEEARRALDGCLLDEATFTAPLKAWQALPDPFPPWDLAAES